MNQSSRRGCHTIYMMLCNYRHNTLIINLLNVNIMDIFRFYHLAYQEPVQSDKGEILKLGFHYLIMDSHYEGEFGTVKCRCVAQIDSPFNFNFLFVETSGEREQNLFNIRQDAIRYFNYHILPLFHPSTHLKDGPLSFQEKE